MKICTNNKLNIVEKKCNNSRFNQLLIDEETSDLEIKKYIEAIKLMDKIIIWGASISGQTVYKFLQKLNLSDRVIGFVDNNLNKKKTLFNELSVFSPNEILHKVQTEENLYIMNAVSIKEIKEQLILLGINENKIDMQCYHRAKAYYQRELIYKHIDECEQVYSMLMDNRSKEIYLAKLNLIVTGNPEYLEDLTDNNKQYFDKEIIKLTDEEVFVDCGSYDGDTLEEFYNLTKGRYKEYIALEADNTIYKKLIKKVKDKGYNNVIVFNKACWYKPMKLKFNSTQAQTGSITDEGNIIIEADNLDHMLNDKVVTFIKMDIEGAEEKALIGAEQLIKNYKPILAISIYHKPEDYYRLPLLMKNLNKEYQLFIRHYSQAYDDTVCYAIPKKRL